MRKIELIELIEDHLSGGDLTDDVKGRFHTEIIKKHLEAVFNGLVMETFLEARRYSDYSILDSWARKYTIAISGISSSKGYVLLPYPPMQLPDNLGIRQVCTASDPSSAYAYRDTNSQAVFSALASEAISTRPFFYLEQNTSGSGTATHLLRIEKIPSGVTNVDVKLIVPLEQVDDYDTVMIPAGKEDALIKAVIELIIGKPRQDEINDNKPGT